MHISTHDTSTTYTHTSRHCHVWTLCFLLSASYLGSASAPSVRFLLMPAPRRMESIHTTLHTCKKSTTHIVNPRSPLTSTVATCTIFSGGNCSQDKNLSKETMQQETKDQLSPIRFATIINTPPHLHASSYSSMSPCLHFVECVPHFH